MAILRNQAQENYLVGLKPPTVTWTVVRGDTAAFRARHNCDTPGPRTKARYWSCKKW